MVKLVNRAKMKVASGGAGTLTLGTACDGYQTFAAAGVTDQNKLRYTITDGDDWEIGIGTYTASGTTLARAPTESSNSGNAITCGSGAEIFVTLAAEDLSVNVAPVWETTPASTLSLAIDGSTAVSLTGKALDEQNFPISYTWDAFASGNFYNSSSLPPQLHSDPTISVNNGTATINLVGTNSASNAGIFNFRLIASDGVKNSTAVTVVESKFFPPLGVTLYLYAGQTTETTVSNVKRSSAIQPTAEYLESSSSGGSSIFSSSGVGTHPAWILTGLNGGGIADSGLGRFGTNADTGTVIFIMNIPPVTAAGVSYSVRVAPTIGAVYPRWETSPTTTRKALYNAANGTLRINKTTVANPTVNGSAYTADQLMDHTKLNSVAISSFNTGSTHDIYMPGNLASSFFKELTFSAVLCFDRNLTDAEIDIVHDEFKSIYGNNMAN